MGSYWSELVSECWFENELNIFEWRYILEWHSECNTISIGNPVRQPLTRAVVQTSINNLNVFKSFQLMLVPLSILLSHAMKFTRIKARTVALRPCLPQCPLTTCAIIAAILKLTAFRCHYESTTRNQVHQKRQTFSQKSQNKPDSSPKTNRLHIQ